MIEGQTVAFDPRWKEHGAEEWSDALVAAMKLGGVEHLFFVSGSEIAFYQESVAKAQERGWPAPRLITVPHEGVALNAALGDTMISGQPSATAVHVDVGTFNYGAALHSAPAPDRGPIRVPCQARATGRYSGCRSRGTRARS